MYKGPPRNKRINLYHHDYHYDVIKSLKAFFGSNFYCEKCDKPFQNIEDHRCSEACYICFRVSCIKNETRRCDDCDRLRQLEECFLAHKSVSGNQKLSICDRVSF